MSTKLVAGKRGPVHTGDGKPQGNGNLREIILEGLYGELEGIDPDDYLKNVLRERNLKVISQRLESAEDGFGRLILACEESAEQYDGSSPYKVSWKIEMSEVQKDLKTHPIVVGDRLTIEKWLATDPDKRTDSDGKPQWVDENGTAHEIKEGTGAWMYRDAYMRGIESYVVHYPIVEKISYYKSIPGCHVGKTGITGGRASFSDVDTWSAPDILLAGYVSEGWLKTGDGYQQDGGRDWVRTEQWTWSPDGRSSSTGWIYS